VALLILLPLASHVKGADTPERPQGVSQNDWVPVNDILGFVIEHGGFTRSDAVVEGHFMIKRGDKWYVLEAHAGSVVVPAVLSQAASH
jgi:hypothetical protein